MTDISTSGTETSRRDFLRVSGRGAGAGYVMAKTGALSVLAGILFGGPASAKPRPPQVKEAELETLSRLESIVRTSTWGQKRSAVLSQEMLERESYSYAWYILNSTSSESLDLPKKLGRRVSAAATPLTPPPL